MVDWLALALQVATGPVLPVDDRLRAIAPCPFDISNTSGGDVVVCARREQSQRLERLPERYAKPDPRKAEARLGPGKLAVEGEKASVGGISVNRAMVRLSIPF
jgi:hypothetical protein